MKRDADVGLVLERRLGVSDFGLEVASIAKIFKDNIGVVLKRLFRYRRSRIQNIQLEQQLLLGYRIANKILDIDRDLLGLCLAFDQVFKLDTAAGRFGGLDRHRYYLAGLMKSFDRIADPYNGISIA